MAKITLRRASALQKAMQELMQGIEMKGELELNEFQSAEEVITAANTKLLANDTRRNDFLMSIYSLRSQVGQANAAAGIADKLAHAAYIDKRIGQLEQLTTKDVTLVDIDVVNGKLDRLRNAVPGERRSVYDRDHVTTGVLTEEQIASIRGVIHDLKKQKQKLNDEVLELNVRTEIELTPEVQAVVDRESML